MITILWNGTASTSSQWIKLSITSGKLSPDFGKKQIRIYVAIDWNKAPKNASFSGQVMFEGDGKQIPVRIYGSSLKLKNYKGFVENNGYVSIYASHYSRMKKQGNSDWQLLPGLGYTGEALQANIVPIKNLQQIKDTGWIRKNSSWLEYDFYSFSGKDASVTVFSLPTHPLNNGYSMRYAVSMDNGSMQIMDFRTFGRSEEWKQNVLSNSASRKTGSKSINPGKHTLRIYSIDPGVILDRILIDLGGLKNAYSAIPESKF